MALFTYGARKGRGRSWLHITATMSSKLNIGMLPSCVISTRGGCPFPEALLLLCVAARERGDTVLSAAVGVEIFCEDDPEIMKKTNPYLDILEGE
jgi:hypothetical protein